MSVRHTPAGTITKPVQRYYVDLLLVLFIGIAVGANFGTFLLMQSNCDRKLTASDERLTCLEEIDAIVSRVYKNTTMSLEAARSFDDVAQQMKYLAQQQDERRKLLRETNWLADLHNAIIPETVCSTIVRLGAVSDGGKWLCNPWRLPDNCRVYSLGVGNDSSFESDLNQITDGRCEITAFDPELQYAELFADMLNVHFLPWTISDRTDLNKSEVSLLDVFSLIDDVKERGVDILKIDIEGGEHIALPPLLRASSQRQRPLFCHLLIEIHEIQRNRHGYWNEGDYESEDVSLWSWWFDRRQPKPEDQLPTGADDFRSMLTAISDAGFILYSHEPNLMCAGGCAAEFSFIHRHCAKRYGVDDLLIRNF